MVLHLKMHNHVIKQNSDMLSDATGCQHAPESCTEGVFNMLNPNLQSDLHFVHSLQAYKLSGTEQQSLKEVTYNV